MFIYKFQIEFEGKCSLAYTPTIYGGERLDLDKFIEAIKFISKLKIQNWS